MKTKKQAKAKANEIVDNWVAATALTGWIPGAGLLSGVGDQVMIRQVADCYGMGVFDMKSVTSHVGTLVGSAMGGTASELLSFVPVVGWAIKAGGLAAKAKVIGELVIDYFEEHSDLPAE